MSIQDSFIFLKNSSSSITYCKVYPIVLFNILDHFIRRNEDHRVIGTLVGNSNEGIVEIKNCFPVPHTEGEQVCVDMEFLHNMLELHHKIAPKENIVGWYATGNELTEASVIIHEFYGKEMNNNTPIHLIVDTNLTNFTLSVKAYTNFNISFSDKILGTQFLPIPLEIKTLEFDKLALDTLIKGSHYSNLSELDNIESSINLLQKNLKILQQYIDNILEGKIVGNSTIGRQIALCLASLPKIDAESLEKMFHNSLQDLLLVIYLANLTRTQLYLAEKLQKLS
jgi:translation initiation factor 3 subunit F